MLHYLGVQLAGGRGGPRLPCPFLKMEEKYPDFAKKVPWYDVGKKCPVLVRLWFKFSFKNAVLRMSSRKNTKISPAGDFFCMPYITFIEVPIFQEISPALKNSWLRACYLMLHCLMLNYFKIELIDIPLFSCCKNLMLYYAVLILHCLMLHYLLHYFNVLLFFVTLAAITLFHVALF